MSSELFGTRDNPREDHDIALFHERALSVIAESCGRMEDGVGLALHTKEAQLFSNIRQRAMARIQ